MVDIAIEIIRNDVLLPGREERELRRGDITMVRRALQTHIDDPRSTAPNKAQIIITGVPVSRARRIKQILEQQEFEVADGTIVDDELEPTREPTQTKFRAWHIPVSLVPVGLRQALANPPYAVKVTWAQARGAFIRRKRDNKAFDE